MTDMMALRASLDIQDMWVFFGFSGFDVPPYKISRALGVAPSTSSYSAVDHALNAWGIMSDILTNDVNEHLRYLLEQFEDRANLIQAEWNPCFEIHWQMEGLPPGAKLHFDADVMRRLVACKASLSVMISEPNIYLKNALAKLSTSSKTDPL